MAEYLLQWREQLPWRHVSPNSPKSAVISSPITRRSRCGPATPLPATRSRPRHRGITQRSARPLSAHSVLPEAMPLLLFPRLHRQELAGGRGVSRRARARVGTLRGLRAIAGRPLNFGVFRRRHAVVLGSAYTAVKDPARTHFVYRDRLWQGADMAGLGVASFGHINGVHIQNADSWDTYVAAIDRGELPLARAYRPTAEERMIRELVLQLKLGSVRPAYFLAKYQIDLLERFADQLGSLVADGYLASASQDARRPVTRGTAARGLPAPPFLPAAAPGNSLHLAAVMPARLRARTRRVSTSGRSILFPLDLVYKWSGVLKPSARTVSPYDIPLPYRSLLVHESDMTMTLEQHFGSRIGLRVLSTFSRGGWFYRRVLLVQEYSGRPVQMGAIRMDLSVLQPPDSCADSHATTFPSAESCATRMPISGARRGCSWRSRRTPR